MGQQALLDVTQLSRINLKCHSHCCETRQPFSKVNRALCFRSYLSSQPPAMNRICAKCAKIVYPVERLDCLDKTWHKSCFKCTICNMTLNLKSFMGYNKYPYCKAHYPKDQPTTIADSVENRRLTQQTKHQSQVEYTKEFNKEKGFLTAIDDDLETRRQMKVSQQVSGISYRNQGQATHQQGRDSYRSAPSKAPVSKGQNRHSTYIAIYDYNARDYDEVTIQEGDIIHNAAPIDDGWMEGRVERTGRYGMFPANYVERK